MRLLNVCTKCGESKPDSEFYKDSRVSSGRRAECKACFISRQDARREELREYNRAYHAANKETIHERKRKHRAEHREEYAELRAERAEVLNERHRRYRKEHPDRTRASMNKVRAKRVSAPGRYTAEDVLSRYKAQKGCCYWCGDELGQDYQVDHALPLSRGGTNWPENIVISCASCNMKKGASLHFAGRLSL